MNRVGGRRARVVVSRHRDPARQVQTRRVSHLHSVIIDPRVFCLRHHHRRLGVQGAQSQDAKHSTTSSTRINATIVLYLCGFNWFIYVEPPSLPLGRLTLARVVPYKKKSRSNKKIKNQTTGTVAIHCRVTALFFINPISSPVGVRTGRREALVLSASQ